jgi:hypothetical protein
LVAFLGNAIAPMIGPSRALISAASCLAILLPVSTAGAQSKSEIEISSALIPVEHVVVKTKRPYREIKHALEGRLGRLDGSIRALLTGGKIDELRIALQNIAG